MADRDTDCDCSRCLCCQQAVPGTDTQRNRRRSCRDKLVKFIKCCGVIGAFSVVMYLMNTADKLDSQVPSETFSLPVISCFNAFFSNVMDTFDSVLRYVGKINEYARFGIKRNYGPRLSDDIIESIEQPDDSYKVSTRVYLPNRDSKVQTDTPPTLLNRIKSRNSIK